MGKGRLMGEAIAGILGAAQRIVYLDGTEVYRGNPPDWKKLQGIAVLDYFRFIENCCLSLPVNLKEIHKDVWKALLSDTQENRCFPDESAALVAGCIGGFHVNVGGGRIEFHLKTKISRRTYS